MSSLKTFRTKYVQLILDELGLFMDEEIAKAKQKDPILVDSTEVLKEFILRGGKRVGPMMVILGYMIAKDFSQDKKSSGNIVRAACAAETHHLYLLNLDDMADRDVLRHGGKSLEEYYRSEVFSDWPDSDHHGRTLSSINGALLGSYSSELLATSGFPAERVLAAQRIINDMLFSDTVVGWQIQYFQNYQPIQEASEQVFFKGLEFVTSRYKFVGPMQMGLHLALDQSHPDFHQLSTIFTQFGKHVGIAFQIRDDIMGVYGDPKEMGKAVGNDVREGKKTLLLQYAYRHGNDEQKKIIEEIINNPLDDAKLKQIQQVVEDTGSLQYSQDLAKQHVVKGVEVLSTLPDSGHKQVLVELAEYMVNRVT